ncbi:IucA/IucC family protein [Streptomyces sp. NPDC094469]|uniref:IucA/IucC family protein n=1 Tax=Streptomyces sp. NPDC094469 TaxID=3366067 RepID=UPI0038279152
MNATPAPDDHGDQGPQGHPVPLAEAVPQQRARTTPTEPHRDDVRDLLEHQDPHIAAQAAAVENLLRCWARETNLPAPDTGTLHIPLPASGTALITPVRHWSPTGWHRFGPPRLAGAPDTAPPVDALTLAALLARETPVAAGATAPRPAEGVPAQTEGGSRPTPVHGGTGLAEGSLGPAPSATDPVEHTSSPFESAVAEECGRTGPVHGRTGPVEAASGHIESAVAEERGRTGPVHSGTGSVAPASRPVENAVAGPDGNRSHRGGRDAHLDGPSRPAHGTVHTPAAPAAGDLVARVADSLRRTVTFIADRRAQPVDGPDRFLTAEQALLLGHPLHPTPKSREGLTDAEARLYSPELRGSFPLHWMAVASSLLATDSAWTERGRPVPAARLMENLAGTALPLPDGCAAALPLHPWQAREIRHREAVATLLDTGLLRDLGPLGAPWHPTSSVRTVYRGGAPAMLKLSLGLRITNSRRENLRKELHRGVEVHRLLRTGLAKHWQAAHPGFDIVRDPAWLGVDGQDGRPVPGLAVMIRHNPFTPADDVSCLAGLTAPVPLDAPAAKGGPRPYRSRLARVVARLGERCGRPVGAVSAEWFLRYLEQVVRPVLWLDGEAGIALEAHQQNTLLLLDADGWPTGGRYRDNQGYYFRESRRAELDARLPGIGEHSDTFVPDDVADERLTYYLGVNNVLGLIGAFGSQRLADERVLLAAFRRFLADVASGPARLRTSLPGRLLDSPVLRCKANLLTRLHGLDELIGPVDTQSVYVTIANPLLS